MSFSAADILVMADVLSLGSATALMYGQQAAAARERLRELSNAFRALAPLPKSDRSEGYAWFNACRAVKDCTLFEAFAVHQEDSWRRDKSSVCVQADSQVFKVFDDIPRDEAEGCVPDLNEFLSQVAPLDARQLTHIKVRAILPNDGKTRWGKELLQSSSRLAESISGNEGPVICVRSAEMDYSAGGDTVILQVAVDPLETEKVMELFNTEPDPSPKPY